MCMLTKRANILFEEKSWKKLSDRARREKTSVGKLVRKAVEKAYSETEDKELKNRREAYEHILRIRKRIKGINYKEYINYGRKY